MRSLIIALGLLLPTLATADPGYFRVTGVAADDTLNVRSGPSASATDIGDLPANATAIEIAGTDPSGRWGQIVWEEGDGWVSMRFLTPDSVPRITGTALPAGLMCSGTEPFWSMRLSQDDAVYSNIEGAIYPMSIRGAQVAEGRPNFPVHIGYAGAGASGNVVIAPESCSDGMSDRDYPWRIELLLGTEGGRRFQLGCCQLPLEVGFH